MDEKVPGKIAREIPEQICKGITTVVLYKFADVVLKK